MSQLTTVPSFMFDQENEDGAIERGVHVLYYSECITLIQGDQEILIEKSNIKRFCKELIKNLEIANNLKT